MSDKAQVLAFRNEGRSYGDIALLTGLSLNTVKSICRRSKQSEKPKEKHAKKQPQRKCQYCGKPITSIPGKKAKKFCSDACRLKWWSMHPEALNRKANYDFTCAYCGEKFTAYGNANRKYCSSECYYTDRFGGCGDGK